VKSAVWLRHNRPKSPNTTLVVAEDSNTIAIQIIGQNKKYLVAQTSSSLVL